MAEESRMARIMSPIEPEPASCMKALSVSLSRPA
jgi:hypothetical protein